MHQIVRSAMAAFLALACAVGHAQNYPAKPVKIIVPYAPGGTSDFVARLIGQQYSERLKGVLSGCTRRQ